MSRENVSPDGLLQGELETEEALRASERRYRILVEEGLGLVCTHDLEGNLLWVNPAAARTLGYTPDQLVGRNLRELLAPQVRHLLDDYLQEFAVKRADSGLMRLVTREGEERFWHFQNALCEEPRRSPYVIGHAIDITDRLHAEESLRDREARLRLLVEQMPAVLWSTDRELRFTSSQGAKLAALGLRPGEVVGRTLWEYFRTEDPDFPPIAAHREALAGESSTYDFEWEGRPFHSHVEPLRDRHGEIVGTIGVARDITEIKRAETEARKALSLLTATLESTADGILVVNTRGRITIHNTKFLEMWRISEEQMSSGDDDRLLELVLDQLEDPDGFLSKVRELYRRPQCESFDVLELKDGRVFERYSQPQRIEDEIVGRVWSFRDVTERRRAEERIEHQAYHDALTGLPNRLLVRDHLEIALASARRRGRSVAVLFLDLDDFKRVNDSLGHSVGDELLQAVAERLQEHVRAGDTIGRLGGDEFTLVLPEIESHETAAQIAGKVLELIAEPFELTGSRLDVTTSIGISLFPIDGEDVETLLRSADTAMYRAKEVGRNTYQLSTPEMNLRAAERMALVTRLHHAVQNDELSLHYQPILDARTRRVVALEALLRWEDETGRPSPPAHFIPVAEQAHLMVPIGEWVLRSACEQAVRWQGDRRGLRIAVNLSFQQFQQQNLARVVAGVLDETGLDPALLELEITETTAMSDVKKADSVLRTLRRTGVRISIDDFGTGQTSLAYLRQLPVNTLKIARNFVEDVAHCPRSRAIVNALVTMAHGLELETIAEGVETEEQLEFVVENGCDAVQGYLLSRPLSAAALQRRLRSGVLQESTD